MRHPRRFREDRRRADRIDDIRKSRELQHAYRNELHRNPARMLR